MVQLGTWLPFHQVPAAAWALLRVAVSAETVRRLTEQAGAALEAVDATTLGCLERGEVVAAEAGPSLQQLSVDGAMVPLVGGQWAEVKTLVIGRVEQQQDAAGRLQPHAVALSYYSQMADAAHFTRTATVETQRRGTDTALRVCAPADGAVWQQGFLDVQRPDAVRILDFPHAVEHLGAAATATFGGSSAAGQAWLRAVRRELRDGDPAEALAWLCRLPIEQAADPEAAGRAQDAEIQYFAQRWAQIQYATFRAAGDPIGSGAVESANKLVMEARLKGSGMHWAAPNVNALLALRTAWCGARWVPRWAQLTEQRCMARAARRRTRGSTAPPPAVAPPCVAHQEDAARRGTPQPDLVAPIVGAAAPDCAPPPAGLRRPAPAHPWRRYGRSLNPRPTAKL